MTVIIHELLLLYNIHIIKNYKKFQTINKNVYEESYFVFFFIALFIIESQNKIMEKSLLPPVDFDNLTMLLVGQKKYRGLLNQSHPPQSFTKDNSTSVWGTL